MGVGAIMASRCWEVTVAWIVGRLIPPFCIFEDIS